MFTWILLTHTHIILISFPDKVRGLFNEGGLFGEREGWHLPGFDISNWTARELSQGLPSGGAGVGFFVTTFDLDFPKETDVLLSFQFETTNTQAYRARLFVNGWMFGKVRCTGYTPCMGLDECLWEVCSAWRMSARRLSSLSRPVSCTTMERSELFTYVGLYVAYD